MKNSQRVRENAIIEMAASIITERRTKQAKKVSSKMHESRRPARRVREAEECTYRYDINEREKHYRRTFTAENNLDAFTSAYYETAGCETYSICFLIGDILAEMYGVKNFEILYDKLFHGEELYPGFEEDPDDMTDEEYDTWAELRDKYFVTIPERFGLGDLDPDSNCLDDEECAKVMKVLEYAIDVDKMDLNKIGTKVARFYVDWEDLTAGSFIERLVNETTGETLIDTDEYFADEMDCW